MYDHIDREIRYQVGTLNARQANLVDTCAVEYGLIAYWHFAWWNVLARSRVQRVSRVCRAWRVQRVYRTDHVRCVTFVPRVPRVSQHMTLPTRDQDVILARSKGELYALE